MFRLFVSALPGQGKMLAIDYATCPTKAQNRKAITRGRRKDGVAKAARRASPVAWLLGMALTAGAAHADVAMDVRVAIAPVVATGVDGDDRGVLPAAPVMSDQQGDLADKQVVDPKAAATPASVIDQVDPPRPSDYSGNLLGGFFGVRPALDKVGVTYNLLYVHQAATNLHGGVRNDLAYADMFWMSAGADLDKLVGLKGASFHVSFTKRSGQDLRATAGLKANLLVNEVFGQGNIYRFNYAYWQQSLFDDAVDVKIGRVSGSFEFFPFTCNFQNLTFCAAIPSYVTPNWVPFPGYTYGVIPKWNVTGHLYVQAGLYQIDRRFRQEERGFSIGPILRGEGSRKNLEIGWSPVAKGMASHLRGGVFFDNVGADDVARDVDGGLRAVSGLAPLRRDNQFGWYVMADRDIWIDPAHPDRKLTLFANLVQADRHVARLRQIAETGFFLRSLLHARPQDDIGFAIGRVMTNPDLTASDKALRARNGTVGIRRFEYPMEVYYSAKVLSSIILQPNLQFIVNPRGIAASTNEVVAGLKSVIIF